MLGRTALHPSVPRRAASYESHPSWVSNPASEPKAAEADQGPCRELPGAEPSARFGSGASPRMPWKTVRRCPSGMCRPACRTGGSASPCLDADGPLAGKSTSRKRPNVSGRVRLFQNVSEPSDTAASGGFDRPPAGLSGLLVEGFRGPRDAGRQRVAMATVARARSAQARTYWTSNDLPHSSSARRVRFNSSARRRHWGITRSRISRNRSLWAGSTRWTIS